MRPVKALLIVLTGLWLAACGEAGPEQDVVTPVYVSWYSHNEEGSYWESLVTDREAYIAYREDLVDKVSLLHQHGVRLNWESDHSVLRAMLEHEQGDLLDDTGGKNILRWMVEDMGMVVDPHGHLTAYNYADLASLIEEMGVQPSGVVGGFALLECGTEPGTYDTTDWQDIIGLDDEGFVRGLAFPEASWRPRVLAQPAMRGHALDEFSAGVWAPGPGEAFMEHQQDSGLVYVGQGYPHDVLNIGEQNSGGTAILYRDAGYIRELADKIASGALPPGRIYTASMHLRDQPQLPGAGSTLEGIRQTLEALDDLVRDGRVVFLDYEGVVALWRERYDAVPNRVDIEQFSIYPELMGMVKDHCWGGEEQACSPPCGEGEVCAPEAGRCVPDCRLNGNPCPPQLPVCNQDDGLCTASDSSCAARSLELSVTNPASGVTWWAKAFFPADATADNRYPAVVTVPGGSGAGSAMEEAGDEARNPCKQAERGFVVVIFDADGRGNTAGVEDDCGHVHQDGLAALIGEVATLPFVDPERIGVSTSSYGITMGSGALARHPELPVRFLVDYEGPGDRTDTGHCDASDTGHLDHDCDDDTWWAEREATTFLLDVRVAYLRIQKERDHVQPDNLHCIRMINNATHTDHGGFGRAPWTRVNGAELNQSNETYTEDDPPAYYPAMGAPEAVDFWDEMFALDL